MKLLYTGFEHPIVQSYPPVQLDSTTSKEILLDFHPCVERITTYIMNSLSYTTGSFYLTATPAARTKNPNGYGCCIMDNIANTYTPGVEIKQQYVSGGFGANWWGYTTETYGAPASKLHHYLCTFTHAGTSFALCFNDIDNEAFLKNLTLGTVVTSVPVLFSINSWINLQAAVYPSGLVQFIFDGTDLTYNTAVTADITSNVQFRSFYKRFAPNYALLDDIAVNNHVGAPSGIPDVIVGYMATICATPTNNGNPITDGQFINSTYISNSLTGSDIYTVPLQTLSITSSATTLKQSRSFIYKTNRTKFDVDPTILIRGNDIISVPVTGVQYSRSNITIISNTETSLSSISAITIS